MNLGYKPNEPVAAQASAPESKTCYPGFSLRDEIAEQFMSEHKPKVGDTFKVLAELKVCELQDGTYGKCVGFEVHEMEAKPDKFEDKDPEEQFKQLKGEAQTNDGY